MSYQLIDSEQQLFADIRQLSKVAAYKILVGNMENMINPPIR